MPGSRSTLRHDLALLGVVCIWGINFPVTKAALEVMPMHVFNAVRFTVAAVVLGGIYAWRHPGRARALLATLRTHGWQIVGLGLLGNVFYQLCFIIGVNRTSAGNAALIMATAPLWTALISRVLGYERLRRWAWAGLGVSLAGATLVIVGGAQQVGLAAGSLSGNLIMLAGAVLWGLYTTLSKPVVRDVAPLTLALFGLLASLPILYGIGLPYAGGVQWQALDVWVWVAIVFSGGLSIGLAYVIWNAAVHAVGPASTAIYNNLVPLVALGASVVLIGEAVTWPQIAGGALIIGGLLVMRRGRHAPAPPAETPLPAEHLSDEDLARENERTREDAPHDSHDPARAEAAI